MKKDDKTEAVYDEIENAIDRIHDGEKVSDLLASHIIVAAFLITMSDEPLEAYCKAGDVMDCAVDGFVELNINLKNDVKKNKDHRR